MGYNWSIGEFDIDGYCFALSRYSSRDAVTRLGSR